MTDRASNQMNNRAVEVVGYDESWPGSFENLRRELVLALGSAARAIHHVGSTSIPAMRAKPVIDVVVEVAELALMDDAASELEKLGYRARGEYGIRGRRYFSRAATSESLPVHLHAFRGGDPQVRRHVLFRDFLRQHPVEAGEYSELKRSLAAAYPDDREAYPAGKANFIEALDRRAAAWASAPTHAP